MATSFFEYRIIALPLEPKILISDRRFGITLERLAHQLIENYGTFENTALVGVQSRGVLLGERLHQRLQTITALTDIPFGKLDITFYRDDFRTRTDPIRANRTEFDFSLDGKRIILVDDVLYSGRTIHAALSALNQYGRPESVELLVMIDRRFNRQIPIEPDYIGQSVDALDKAYVRVQLREAEGTDQVLFFPEGKA